MEKEYSIWQKNHKVRIWNTYPEGSMYNYILTNSQGREKLPALEFENKKTSYARFLKNIHRISLSLYNLGFKKGDYVTIISPNFPQAVEFFYAVNRLGGVANMLHPMLSQQEIQEFIESVDSKFVLILDQIYPKIKKFVWKEGFCPKIITFRVLDALPMFIKPFYYLGNHKKYIPNEKHDVIGWNAFLNTEKKYTYLPCDDGTKDDLAVILYSGGTTGTPKGTMLTNGNLNSLAVQLREVNATNDDVAGVRSLAIMPIFHGFGLGVCVHGMLGMGCHLYLVPKYDFKKCSDLIFKKKMNFIYGVPALFETLLRDERIDKDLSHMQLLVVGGDKPSEKLLTKFNEKLKKNGSTTYLAEAYGQTECVAGCSINPFFAPKIGSLGIPYSDVKMKIVRYGTTEELPVGETGELCVLSPTNMRGYFGHEKETALALQKHGDGNIWLHTGDLCHQDKDGYFYYDQRGSRMIISAGYNIYPEKIERAIRTSPTIADCYVLGKKDKVLGAKICAFVIPTAKDADKDFIKNEVLTACKKAVPEYSLPQEIILKEAFPLTSLSKVDYNALLTTED